MKARLWHRALLLAALALSSPAFGQITVLDEAQDAAQAPGNAAPPPVCGTAPITIASMPWPSAELLAQIHRRILEQEFGCSVTVTPGDLAATGSSMGSSGQPAIAPEMWVTRIPDVWNAAIEAQMLRPAAPTFVETQLEGWFVPDYLAGAQPGLLAAEGLAAALPALGEAKPRFISCPADWACALINRNLVQALGIGDLVELVEPPTRFEMDALIAEAVNLKQPFLFYYWQPNAVLAQLGFVPVDLGVYNQEAAQCLARVSCPDPQPSAFSSETVVIAAAEWVFTDMPEIAVYLQQASLPLAEMNALLAELSETGAGVEAVAQRFVTEREDLWRSWIGRTS